MTANRDQQTITLTKSELRALMRETVRETLTEVGVDVDDPIQMQRDFQHLREWRETTAAIRRRGMLTAVAIVVSGALAALWVGVKSLFLNGG